jgi:hypothetical protein
VCKTSEGCHLSYPLEDKETVAEGQKCLLTMLNTVMAIIVTRKSYDRIGRLIVGRKSGLSIVVSRDFPS